MPRSQRSSRRTMIVESCSMSMICSFVIKPSTRCWRSVRVRYSMNERSNHHDKNMYRIPFPIDGDKVPEDVQRDIKSSKYEDYLNSLTKYTYFS